MADPIITPELDSTIPDNSTGDSLEALIRDYTMGQPTATENVDEKFTPQPLNDPHTALYNVAGNISGQQKAQEQKKQKIMKEKEQQEKGYNLKKEFMARTQSVLNDATPKEYGGTGTLDYETALTKLGSLQMQAESAGLKDVSDVIGTVAKNNVAAVAKMKDAQDARLSKRYAKSIPIKQAKEQAKVLQETLQKEGYDTNLTGLDFKAWDEAGEWIDKEQFDTAIDTARTRAYLSKVSDKGIGNHTKDEIEKMHQNILNIKTKIANRSKTQGLISNKRAQAALDIQELVSAGATIEDAYGASVKNKTEWFGWGDTVPTWKLEDVLTPDQMKLVKEQEDSWKPVREWFNNKKLAKNPPPAGGPAKDTAKKTYPEFATEAEARKAGFKKGAVVRIGGVLGKLE